MHTYLCLGTHGLCTQDFALLDGFICVFLVPKACESSSPRALGFGIDCKADISKGAKGPESIVMCKWSDRIEWRNVQRAYFIFRSSKWNIANEECVSSIGMG